LASVDVVPSPKSHRYVNGLPSGLVVPALENVTDRGDRPALGAVGALAATPL
jgi:hypothetical protein